MVSSTMAIAKDSVVTLSYQLYEVGGDLLEDGDDDPMVYLHGGYDGIFPQVEEALHGKKVGDAISVEMSAEMAFGEYDDDLLQLEPRDEFPKDAEVGMIFEGEDPESGETILFTITRIDDKEVELDGNHPFSGLAVRFEGAVLAVRESTAEERTHGHVHDPDHPHHH